MSVDELPDVRPFWMTVPCPAWCVSGHSDDDAVDDRLHWASWRGEVWLSLEDETNEEFAFRHKHRTAFTPPFLRVDLLQRWREARPRLWVGWRDTNRGYHLSPTEARELAAALIQGADLAEGVSSPSTSVHAIPVLTRTAASTNAASGFDRESSAHAIASVDVGASDTGT